LNPTGQPASLAEFLKTHRELVDRALSQWLPQDPSTPDALLQAMRYAVFPGGKRLRPMLALMASHACGGSVEAALPGACAVEYIHCYSLVHDDLPSMDDDDLRRGRPTCHKVFGEAMAILAGDALLTLAFEVLARHCQSPEVAADSCRELAVAAGACGMVGGQVVDISASRGKVGESPASHASIEMIESMHMRKTGALLCGSVRLGGLAAGASRDALEALGLFGQRIGLAFQITDDLLDVTGTEGATGKRLGKDASRGKWTFPRVLGTEECRRRAQALCEGACEAVAPLGERAKLLRDLAWSILERDR
jgi:geranylgeranyl diphosphate synthase type II